MNRQEEIRRDRDIEREREREGNKLSKKTKKNTKETKRQDRQKATQKTALPWSNLSERVGTAWVGQPRDSSRCARSSSLPAFWNTASSPPVREI